MASLNKVMLIGYLGGDPEERKTGEGKRVVTLNVATTETWIDKSASLSVTKEKTEWHKVVIFNQNLCDFATEHLKKGDRVYVEGKLQTRKWDDKSPGGLVLYKTEIVLGQYDAKLIGLVKRGETWDVPEPEGDE